MGVTVKEISNYKNLFEFDNQIEIKVVSDITGKVLDASEAIIVGGTVTCLREITGKVVNKEDFSKYKEMGYKIEVLEKELKYKRCELFLTDDERIVSRIKIYFAHFDVNTVKESFKTVAGNVYNVLSVQGNTVIEDKEGNQYAESDFITCNGDIFHVDDVEYQEEVWNFRNEFENYITQETEKFN